MRKDYIAGLKAAEGIVYRMNLYYIRQAKRIEDKYFGLLLSYTGGANATGAALEKIKKRIKREHGKKATHRQRTR